MNTIIIIIRYGIKKKFCFSNCIKMSNPSLNELKQIAKSIRIKNYKNMSKEELLSALDELDNYSKNNSNNAGTKKIRDRFLRPEIKEIMKNL